MNHFVEETVPTRVPFASSSRNLGFTSDNFTTNQSRVALSAAPNPHGTVALTIEFVAKPETAKSAPAFLPNALLGALSKVAGFAGCLVMSSDQEARLITVITFWTGNDSHRRCQQNVRWLRALLASYVDRYLRVQTLLAQATLSQDLFVELNDTETNEHQTRLIPQQAVSADETVCVA